MKVEPPADPLEDGRQRYELKKAIYECLGRQCERILGRDIRHAHLHTVFFQYAACTAIYLCRRIQLITIHIARQLQWILNIANVSCSRFIYSYQVFLAKI